MMRGVDVREVQVMDKVFLVLRCCFLWVKACEGQNQAVMVVRAYFGCIPVDERDERVQTPSGVAQGCVVGTTSLECDHGREALGTVAG